MNEIHLYRNQYLSCGIFGKLCVPDGIFFAVTLEHAYDPNDASNAPYGKTVNGVASKIPAGTYPCILFDSPHLGYRVWMLTGIPGHDHCLIHKANFMKDVIGCIGIGEAIAPCADGTKMITESKTTFDAFMEKQKSLASFSITIHD